MNDLNYNAMVGEVLVASDGLIEPDVLYSSEQTAAILSISAATIARWRREKSGRGPVVTVLYKGALPKYRGKDILTAMDRSRQPLLSQKWPHE